MKHFKLRIFSLILAVMLALIATGTVFAWFTVYTRDLNLDGASAGAYFKDGDGSQEDPFSIGNALHMYNFAWLQNTGRIPDGTYFDIDPDEDAVEMTINGKNVIIPPIGTKEHPFNGYFDGKGNTIRNLVVSTNKDVLYGNPASDTYTFSNAVGFFGKTGSLSEISNFILDNPTVEVADEYEQNTVYEEVSESDPMVTGLAIGYVGHKASSIGVIGGNLAVRRLQYKTVNSIIGKMNTEAENQNNLTGNGGSGSNYGSSFDVELFLDRLLLMYENNKDGNSWRLPEIDYNSYSGKTGSKFPYPANQDIKIPFTVTEDSTYEGAQATEVVSPQNMGYFVGSQNKINRKRVTFFHDKKYMGEDADGNTYYLEKLINPDGENPNSSSWSSWTLPDGTTPLASQTTPKWLYTNTNAVVQGGNSYAPASGFRPLTDTEFNDLPDGIKNLIVDDDDTPTDNKVDHMTIRFTNLYYLSGEANTPVTIGHDLGGPWGYYGQIEWMGKTYYQGLRDRSGNAVDEEGNIIADSNGEKRYHYSTNGVYLPNNTIWFKPARAGKIRFVVYADDLNETFMLAKVKRMGVTKENKNINPFYSDPTLMGADGDIQAEVVMAQKIPSPYVLMYYEYEVTQAEIDAGNVEYFLAGYNDSGAYFVYLDIGASAEVESSTEQADPTKFVTAIDFIYRGVTITNEDVTSEDGNVIIHKGSFVVGDVLYIETGTMLNFGGSGAIICFYYRDEDDGAFSAAYSATDNELVSTVEGKATITQTTGALNIDKDYQPSVWIP